jgi:hypothetical protein
LTLIFLGKYGKILVQCGTQSGFKDPRILNVTGPPASVLVPAGLEAVMVQDHTRAPDENQSLTTEFAADG